MKLNICTAAVHSCPHTPSKLASHPKQRMHPQVNASFEWQCSVPMQVDQLYKRICWYGTLTMADWICMYKGKGYMGNLSTSPQLCYSFKLFFLKVYFTNIPKSLAMRLTKIECWYGVIHWEIAERIEQCSVICPLHVKTHSSKHHC